MQPSFASASRFSWRRALRRPLLVALLGAAAGLFAIALVLAGCSPEIALDGGSSGMGVVPAQPAPDRVAGARCLAAGTFCGGDGVTGGDDATLYTCLAAGGAPSQSMACPAGCEHGSPDACKALPPPTPVCLGGGGDYCGSDQVQDGQVDTLYHCPTAGQPPTSATPCANGCQVNTQGTNDLCRPGIACPGGGDYCGADGVQGGDANTLYHCPGAGQPPTGSEPCSAGCQINPQGTNDVCAVKLTCPTAGDYCGDDGVGGPSNVLYHCTAAGAAPTSSTTCQAGCIKEPQGVNDLCAGAGCSAQGQAALNWEANQLASGNSWSSLCLGFVNNAYAAAGNSPWYLHVGSAAESLADARTTGQFVPWNGTCPCGGILYWDGNNCNAEWGHVVICNGDGTVSTSGWNGFYGSTNASITWLDGQECGHTPAGYIIP